VSSCKPLRYGGWGGEEAWINSYLPSIIHRDEVKKIKVKCTLVQALRLCIGRAAHRSSRGLALLFLDHGTRRG